MTLNHTVVFSKHTTNLFFHILTQCNLTCRHCYINPEQHGSNSLPLSTITAWLNAFSQNSSSKNLIFLGGEPTLHPDLALAVKYARKLGFGSVTIDTNGYLFHDILSKVTPGEVDFFSFSLDGAAHETNDDIRGEGSFDTCIEGIQNARSKGFATSLIYTVSILNIDELEMMVPLLKELAIDRFFIQVIGLRGRSAVESSTSNFLMGYQISRSKWLNTVPKVARMVAELGITVNYPKVFLEPDETFECAGLVADNYFIFPNGRVYRCPLCEDFPVHSLVFREDQLVQAERLNETDFFHLTIPEGCVMNKLIQPYNLSYNREGQPEYKIACCLLKEEIQAVGD